VLRRTGREGGRLLLPGGRVLRARRRLLRNAGRQILLHPWRGLLLPRLPVLRRPGRTGDGEGVLLRDGCRLLLPGFPVLWRREVTGAVS
jgi:hypothetical protein